jgi:hypothetical protein
MHWELISKESEDSNCSAVQWFNGTMANHYYTLAPLRFYAIASFLYCQIVKPMPLAGNLLNTEKSN